MRAGIRRTLGVAPRQVDALLVAELRLALALDVEDLAFGAEGIAIAIVREKGERLLREGVETPLG